MQYAISKAKSAEYLRLAIQYMANQQAAFHPVSYALWYEYVSGQHQRLIKAVDAQLAATSTLDEATTFQLFEQHIAQANAESASSVVSQVDRMMQEMQQGSGDTASRAEAFKASLEHWAANLQQSHTASAESVEALLADTIHMQQSIHQLQQSLSEHANQIKQLQAEITRAREDSMVDALTGLVNRQGFELALNNCLTSQNMPETAGAQTCIVLADIDHFARLNDSYGHLFGDRVIQSVADILQKTRAEVHTAARYNVEEFMLLLPETSLTVAEKMAEHLRQQVAALRFKHTLSPAMIADVTLSVGVTTYQHGETPDTLLTRVQQAVEASKAKGRNQVTTLRH